MVYATNLFIVALIALTACVANVAGDEDSTTSPSFFDRGVAQKNKFASEYTIVTSKTNFQVNYKRLPGPGIGSLQSNPNYVLGSTIIQSGNVFRPNSINLVQVLENFAGGVQPETTPDLNSAFTFNGECVATAGVGLAVLKAHTCVFNLCLRGSQNCIFLYAGTAFNFNAAPGLTDVPGSRGFAFQNSNFFTLGPSGANSNPLPPSFPGVIIGGCNDFSGITGNFDLITVAGTLPFQPDIAGNGGEGVPILETFAPTSSPTTSFPTSVGETDVPSSQPTGKPTFDGTATPTDENLEPAIVQKLFVKSNIRLPRAPKATGAKNQEDNSDS